MEEVLHGTALDKVFTLDFFNKTLTQKGIDSYNAILGGKSEKGQKKIKGMNEYINLYRQQKGLKLKQLPNLKPLYKQILSDRESISFLPEAFEKDQEVLDSIEAFYQNGLCAWEKDGKTQNVIQEIKELLLHLSEFNLEKIFIKNDASLTGISQKIFGDWSLIGDALGAYYEYKNPVKRNKSYEEKKEKWVTKTTHFSIADIQKALDLYKNQNDEAKEKITANVMSSFFGKMGEAQKEGDQKALNLLQRIEESYGQVKDMLNTPYPEKRKLAQEKTEVSKIKNFLDSIMDLLHFLKPLHPKDITQEKDEAFYSAYSVLFDQLNLLTDLYNKTRNYLTQKPYSTEKIKLNFENKGDFLGGWVDSHTEDSDNATQSGGYLFRKKNEIDEYDYFLGISGDKKLFRSHEQNNVKDTDKSKFERLDYYQLKTASLYGNSYKGNYNEDKSNLISVISKFAQSKKGNTLFRDEITKHLERNEVTPNSCLNLLKQKFPEFFKELIAQKDFSELNNTVIDNLKTALSELNRVPNAKRYATKEYKLFSEVIADVEQLAKEKVYSYFPVSQKELDEALNRAKQPLFFFKISNKDLSYAERFTEGKRKSRGTENMHTLYFKQLMSSNQNVFDIGTGEVFYRQSSTGLKESTVIHPRNKAIQNKNPKNGKKDSIFDYAIVKDKRFTESKFHFHLSTIINYQQPKKLPDFNNQVLAFLKNNPDINIIGIDRGERHLLYVTLIDQHRKIKQQFSLNEIINRYKGKEYPTNYHAKLDARETERDEARKSWGVIENIKELKEGYLSQVVHQIACMMVENNAIVVMEDLNFGFKRGRQKVEKQVYQKFEKMLIDKLNCLVFKNKEAAETGGVLNALQLSNKFESFQKLGKQSGFIFYVPAWHTSKIDPATGFVNFLQPKYENIEKAKEFFGNFERILFNKEKEWFEFDFDYSKFTPKVEDTRTQWTVCTTPEVRYVWNRNKENTNGKGGYDEYLISEKLKFLFDGANISYQNGSDIKQKIVEQASVPFFKELTRLLNVTLALRYNNGKKGDEEKDFILSPVADEKGEFFHSLKADASQPQNADANGAYHIALKGLWALQQVNNADDLRKVKLAISNKEWLNFAQR